MEGNLLQYRLFEKENLGRTGKARARTVKKKGAATARETDHHRTRLGYSPKKKSTQKKGF